MSKKKRLGRGLEALLGVGKPSEEKSTESPSKTKVDLPGVTSSKNSTNPTSSLNLAPNISSSKDAESTKKENQVSEPTILKFPAKEDLPQSTSQKTTPENMAPSLNTDQTTVSVSGDDPGDVVDVRSLTPGQLKQQKSASTLKKTSGGNVTGVVDLNVYDVDDNPFQPRREFNKSEIESLAESLKTHEQLQPILVRKVGERYQLISGERRLRAAVHAGWSKIRAQVREADDRLVAELAIVENLQRKDLNPVEKALSFRRYLDQHSCTQDELAGRLKIDRSTVANLLRLLDLPDVVQKAIQMGIISNGHARALLPLGEEHLQIEFCNRIQREGLSVRAIEQMVRDKIDEEDGVKRKTTGKSRAKNAQIVSLENELRNALGTRVEIKSSSRGRGKIVVHYLSRDEFERLRIMFADSANPSNRDAT